MEAGTVQDASPAGISPPTIVDVVVEEVRTLILSGSLKPGERLIEERLTERYGISRPPLREALRILQHEGLLHRIPRKGVVVTPLTADDVREIYTLRWALERFALQLALPIEDPARLEPLRKAIAAMREAGAAGSDDALLEANLAFHTALCSLPGHGRLIQTYTSLMRQLRLCMAMNLRFRREVTGDPDDAVRRHSRLLAVIESGDLDAVYREIETHGDRAFMTRLEEFISSG
jgi:DNA-binding GntR family transcriptional regulator